MYPTYIQSTGDPTIAGYWRAWLDLPFWPSGPVWFLWLLVLWDVLAAGVYLLVRRHGDRVLRLSFYARRRPAVFLGGLLLGSALAYVPLALIFGPASWFQAGPFAVQFCRPLHYVLYFFAGAAIGACGIERGLFAPDGPLVRRWAAVGGRRARAVLALGRADGARDPRSLGRCLRGAARAARRRRAELCARLLRELLFRVRRRGAVRRGSGARLLDSLKANAFGMYLVHYLFVVWLQFALLGLALPASRQGGDRVFRRRWR